MPESGPHLPSAVPTQDAKGSVAWIGLGNLLAIDGQFATAAGVPIAEFTNNITALFDLSALPPGRSILSVGTIMHNMFCNSANTFFDTFTRTIGAHVEAIAGSMLIPTIPGDSALFDISGTLAGLTTDDLASLTRLKWRGSSQGGTASMALDAPSISVTFADPTSPTGVRSRMFRARGFTVR